MTVKQLLESLQELVNEGHGSLKVITSNSDSPSDNYGLVYFGARVKEDPEDERVPVVWVE